MIKAVTVYRTMGQQFERFTQALNYRENEVERFLCSLPGFYDVPLKQRIAFVEALLVRRQELCKLLAYSDKPETEFLDEQD